MNKFQLLILAGVGFTIATSIFLPCPTQAKGLNAFSQPEVRKIPPVNSFENRLSYSTLALEERPRCQGDPPKCKKVYLSSTDETFTLLESNVQVSSKLGRREGFGGSRVHDDSHVNQVDIAERLAQVDSYPVLNNPFKVFERPRVRGGSGRFMIEDLLGNP